MFLAELLVGLVVLYRFISSKLASRSNRVEYEELTEDGAIPAELEEEDHRQKLKGKLVFLLAIPASCDLLATTIMNIGLMMVPVSVYQMVRGAIVLFVGFFSVTFLKRHLLRKQWAGLLTVFGGVFIVGLSAMFSSGNTTDEIGGGVGNSTAISTQAIAQTVHTLFIRATGGEDPEAAAKVPDPEAAVETTLGVVLILVAQLFVASQFVIEEFILEKYAMDPLNVVMWEGAFGSSIILVGSLIISKLFISKEAISGSMFNLVEAFEQMYNNKAILFSSIAILFMMSTFNVTGMTVTRILSATSRSTVDTSRTVGIWFVSLIIGWEHFHILQLGGFLLLVYGTLLFNGIVGNSKEAKENIEELLPHEFEHT